MSRVLCYGVVGMDYLLNVSQYPEPNGHAKVRREEIAIGGEAANTAVRLSQLGLYVTLMGNDVGSDELGDRFLEAMGVHNVDCRIEAGPGTTGHAYVVSDTEGARTILGAFGDLVGPVVPESLWTEIDLVTLDPFVAGAEEVGQLAREKSLPVVTIEAAPGSRLAAVSNVVINSAGFIRRHDAGDPARIAEALLADGVETVVITRGAAGADVFAADHSFHIPACDADVVDTTGAGDGFRAGLIAGLLKEMPIQDCLKLASVVGALSCCYYGGCGGTVDLDTALGTAHLA